MAEQVTGPRFVHLKVHSAYSLLEGALTIGKIAKLAAADAMPAVALTDTSNLFGALEFSDKLAGLGIQPIVGMTLALDFGEARATVAGKPAAPVDERDRKDGRLTLIAKSEAGYQSLMHLASRAYLGPDDAEAPHITLADLTRHADGLIVLTGGPDGPIDLALGEGKADVAQRRLETLRAIAGDRLYIEIQRHGLPAEKAVEPQLLALAYDLEAPLVATNECYFASPDDYEAHDALICIAEGSYVTEDNRRRLSRDHYFKTQAEMAERFRDLPEALANTVEIARRCAFRPKGRKPMLPRFVDDRAATAGIGQAGQMMCGVGPDEIESRELKRMAEEGLSARLSVHPLAPGFTRADYEKRLAFEVDVIAKMKFPGYFLIVADFIKWAKAHDIPVGPGRGSGAGSVVAWSLTITDLDPLRFGLLFERFLNPERVSMPDFDIDFCQDRRDEVIRYVQQKYGADRVAQIITYGKLQARAVLRDVGRVLQMPYGQVDKLCKLVPNNPANPVTLKDAIDGEPKLQEARDGDAVVAKLFETSMKLEGLYRHASTHAAGVVIGDRPLVELVPLYRDPRAMLPATQFNMKWVEQAGLVKFDFLGLKTLTVLTKAVALLKQRGIDLDLARLPLDDRRSYELLARAETTGVFQLESTGMRDSLRRLKPDRFEDIIAMVALYRPGPMDNIPTYINRKHGEEPVDCLHDMLEPILKETYGVIIYQEQVMQIAQVMAGYSLGEADLLRRAMGKKIKEEMAKQKSRFVEGATAKGVRKADAEYIFELVDKFAGYGFNKSHAAAYALVAYHTAYLKANHPVEFIAASMTLDMANTDKLAMFAAEARRLGIEVRPPSVNVSGVEFGAEEGAIRYALAALKNIGQQAVSTVVDDRAAKGPYKSLASFAARMNPKALNKRALETLAAAGAFDMLEANRALVHGNVDQLLDVAGQQFEDCQKGQGSFFGGGAFASARRSDTGDDVLLKFRPKKMWLPMERLQHEFDAVGFFLSGHPLDEYQSTLAKLGADRWAEFEAKAERGVAAGLLAGIVINAKERRSKSGNKFAFAAFSDPTGSFEAVIFSDTLNAAGDLLEPGTPVLIRVEAERDGETMKVRAQTIESLEKAARNVQCGLKVVLDRRALAKGHGALDQIRELLKPGGKGNIRLVVPLEDHRREVEFALPGGYDISPQEAGALKIVPGVLEVSEI